MSKAKQAPASSAGRKAPPKNKVARKKAVGKKVSGKTAPTEETRLPKTDIAHEERWKMICIAAYHRAEKRGFVPGYELEDWIEAEKAIDALLSPK